MLSDDFLVTLEHDVTRVVMTLMNIEREIRVATPGQRVYLRRCLESGVWRDKTYLEIV